MAKGPDETTDKMFPPPENANPERPIPLTPSIREEFLAHRLHFDSELTAFRAELGAALAQLAPVPTVGKAMQRGAAVGGKATVIGLAVVGLLEVVIKTWKPEWSGPVEMLRTALGG